MPDARAALQQLGVNMDDTHAGRFQGIKFLGQEGTVAARFPKGEGIGIRRTVLHQALLDFARSLGVETLWGRRVSPLNQTSVVLDNTVVHARWLIGADGQNSQVRKWAGLSEGREHARRIGMRCHFPIGPRSKYVEIYWGRDGQAYVTPIGPQEICVALISRKKFVSFEHGIAHFPVLARYLQDVPCTTSARGAVTVSQRLKSISRGRIALIGEASGSVDAITGEGMAMAFRQALALGRALSADDLSIYEAAHRQISNLPACMAHGMLLMDRSSWIREHALRAFAAHPPLFERLLSIHVGESSLRSFGARGILNLGWRLLAA